MKGSFSSKNTRTCEPAVKTSEYMRNEARSCFAKVRVRQLACDPGKTVGSWWMLNHLLKFSL